MRISQWNIDEAEVTISRLLGRIVCHNRIPVTPHQLWEDSWTDKFRKAYQIVMAESASSPFGHRYEVWCPIATPDQLYSLHLTMPNHGLTFVPYTANEPRALGDLYTGEIYDLMNRWMIRCTELRAEIDNASAQLHQILRMANTAGQLRRMVPDLLRYLPSEYTIAASTQERRSSLPSHWASTPREPIHAALSTLAKAALLEPPKQGTGPNEGWWEARSIISTNWAFKPTEMAENMLRIKGWKCI